VGPEHTVPDATAQVAGADDALALLVEAGLTVARSLDLDETL
jgi:hypothetical protein